MIFVLLGDVTIVDHKRIPVDVRDVTAGHIEVLKRAIDDFIGRYNMVVVPHDIVQIHAPLLITPGQRAQVIAQIINFFLHLPDRNSVKMIIKTGKINVGRKYRLHRHHTVIGFFGILVGRKFDLSAHQAVL